MSERRVSDERRCKGEIPAQGGFHFYRCRNKALPESSYCGLHDPTRRKEREAKRGPTKWQREIAAEREKHERLVSAENALAAEQEAHARTKALLRRVWGSVSCDTDSCIPAPREECICPVCMLATEIEEALR